MLTEPNPLTFLTVPDAIWQLMTSHTGRPNRKLVDYYKAKLKAVNYSHKIYVSHVIGRDEEIIPHKEKLKCGIDYGDDHLKLTNEIGPKLFRRFRNLSNEELLVAGIFFKANKWNDDKIQPNDTKN